MAFHSVSSSPYTRQDVRFSLPDGRIDGVLMLPSEARGIVVFAHGSGSSRHSPRNQYVAQILQSAGFGTLLMDLLTRQEESIDTYTLKFRFDIGRLADRLVMAIDWLSQQPETVDLPVGLFGASTGAAAALQAAAARPNLVKAVVSRGGRPDLAGVALEHVQAPTLLIVGADDTPVIPLNELARQRLRAPAELVLVPGATHLFEEPGTLGEAARLASDWFAKHLSAEVPDDSARSTLVLS